MRWLIGLIIGVSAGLAVAVSSAQALDVPKAPPVETPIVDQTGVLRQHELQQLTEQIAKSRKERSYQIGVLIIPTLGNGEYLEGYSLKVARQWGIGEKGKDNGVLLLVALNDRKLRIEVGRGLEGDLTDVRANRIIRNVITPKFKEGKYYEGIAGGVNSIQLAVAKKADPSAEKEANAGSGNVSPADWSAIVTVVIFLGLAIFQWLGAILGRSKSWWAGGVIGGIAGIVLMALFAFAIWAIVVFVGMVIFGLLFDFLVSRNYKQHAADHSSPAWWAGGTWGGGGGWGSGSGGGSFGGGGFSGGGSSGSW